MAQLRVFLSHSSQDKAFADQLVAALRQAGADVWYDESHLGTGQLLDEINRQLRVRPAFIVLLSPAAFASNWVRDECRWAYQLYSRDPSRIILPVVISPIASDAFDEMLFLDGFKRVEGPNHQPYTPEKTIAHTLSLLKLTPVAPTPLPTTPQTAESVDDLVNRGEGFAATGDWQEALTWFEAAIQREPRYVQAWIYKVRALLKLNRNQEALAASDQALTQDPTNAVAWGNKGRVLNRLSQPAEALEALDHALALDPNDAVVWANRGFSLGELGRYVEALGALDRALALDTSVIVAWLYKGWFLDSLGREVEALAALDHALALDPNLVAAWVSKAHSLRKLGRAKEAEEAELHAEALRG